jgi:large subunit ribosomal protein L5
MSLKQSYRETIQPKLLKDLNLSNVHEVPKVIKVTINRGLGEAAQNAKALEASIQEIATITGQKALVTRAKKAIAGFKIRAGMPIGVAVTLRGDRMYAFLERLINLALPRIRDFRGVSPKALTAGGTTPWDPRANHLSGDLLRQDRRDPGHGHHHRDQCP